MPIHVVEKKIPHIDLEGNMVKPEQPNGYKFETLVLDMVHMMDDCIPYEVVRERRICTDQKPSRRGFLRHCERVAERLRYYIIIPLKKSGCFTEKAKKNMKNRVKWAFAGNPGRRPFCAKRPKKI